MTTHADPPTADSDPGAARGADGRPPPALGDDAVAVGAIADGSAVLAHDGYDVAAFGRAARDYGRLGRLVEEAGGRLRTAPALLRDVYWAMFKAVPRVAPPAPLTPAHALNRRIVEELLGTAEWRDVRAAGTVGDELTSAMATIGAAGRALAALDDATVARANALAELEASAADLLARAETLDDLARQADGERAVDLFARAEAARHQAARDAARAEELAGPAATDAAACADAVRRAGRAGLAAAAAEIDRTNEALAAFGGGGVGAGPGGAGGAPLTTREKLALARQVSESRTLREIAAMAGRLVRVALQVQATRVVHPPDEITSIAVGDDLAHLLPAELALLADPDLEDLFWARFSEKRLLQYELVGHEPQGKGPVILAVDNSGSMAGPKEIWSKAVALALLAIAGKQRRDLAVLHFGGTPDELRVFRFPKGQAKAPDVVACAAHFFGGGTTFAGWMRAALRLIDEAAFDKADVIVISDGLVHLDQDLRADWQRRRRERGMRCFGVLIGAPEGAGALASVADAVLTMAHPGDDRAALETIFAI